MKFCQRRCNNLPGGSLPLGKEHRNYNPLQAIKAFLQTCVTLVKILIWLDLAWFGLIWLDLAWFGLICESDNGEGHGSLEIEVHFKLHVVKGTVSIFSRDSKCYCTIHYGNLEIFIWSILWIVIIPICVPAVEVRKSFL